jgi:hypothetical protein
MLCPPKRRGMHKLCKSPGSSMLAGVAAKDGPPPPDVGVSLGRALGPGELLYHLLCKTSMLSQTGEHGPLFGDGVIIVVSGKAYMY